MKLNWQKRIFLSSVGGLMGGLFASFVAQAQSNPAPSELDCVIEPHSVVSIGTPNEGIIEEIDPDYEANGPG